MTWDRKYHLLNIHSLEEIRLEVCIWNVSSCLWNSIIIIINIPLNNVVIVFSIIRLVLDLIIKIFKRVFAFRDICWMCGEISGIPSILESCWLIIYRDAVVKVRLNVLIGDY